MLCKIHLVYTGQLRSAVGMSEDALEFAQPVRLSEALTAAAEKRGAAARRILLNEDGKIQRALVLMVGGAQVPRGSDPVLENGAQLTIMTPISGG
ncbi:MAG: MoaD/ThiS family protein [Candidatus Poribacteria bacterium]|nr:MoaD/ThiS family protein [Candidatus Poribacteria bacterium]